jgi:Fe2+ or Zn2+ uptake regulation protein
MSIEKYKGEITFCCDNCKEVLDTELTDFSSALSLAKMEGWKIKKLGIDWFHYCSEDCAHE